MSVPTVTPTPAAAQRLLPETSGTPIKAALRTSETDTHTLAEQEMARRKAVGAAIDYARRLAGLSVKQLSGEIGIARGRAQDPAEVSRWLSGAKRPPIDSLMAVPVMRQPLLIALARLLDDGAEISTTIVIKRIA